MVPQGQEDLGERGLIGQGLAILRQFSQHDADQADLVDVDQHVVDCLM